MYYKPMRYTRCDLVITGEGQMDNQTLQGKTPYGINNVQVLKVFQP